MKVLDPGHKYELDNLDSKYNLKTLLIFVKREGDKYPGNIGHYEGTNLQEVIRVLIDRIKYLDNQIHDDRNITCIQYLRNVLWLLEDRAAERHNRSWELRHTDELELFRVCKICG